MAEPLVITAAQVAELLGITPERLRQTGARLRRAHGFPPALPGSGGRRYSRAVVTAWIDGHRPPAPHNPAMEADVSACEAVLLRRAGAMMVAE